MKDFKKNDVIDYESDRNTRTRKVSEKGNPVKVVVLKLEVKYEETNDMQEKYQRLMKLERQLEEGKSEERIIESKERREEAERSKKKAVKTKSGHKETTKDTMVVVKGSENLKSILDIDLSLDTPITVDDLDL